ncbi:hypothetical protein ENBRE01_1658 [Enteropsectra breve]|nr:hypothetical protein ENBRE01_1658 [Enteropsectra breve]
MIIFHILITAVSCISYTAHPSEMLLVDKRELLKSFECDINCTLCGTLVLPSINPAYNYMNKTSFQNYCYCHFRCSCCSSIFHASCFVRERADKLTTCPNPSCHTIFSPSEMERFFGQLLLSYAHNDGPIGEFKKLYDEYKIKMYKDSDIKAHPPNFEPITFASIPSLNLALFHVRKRGDFPEKAIFMNILINGRMAHVLMDPRIWDKLANYLISKNNCPEKKKEYIHNLMGAIIKRPTPKNLHANNQPIFTFSDKLYHIRLIVNALSTINDINDYMNIYQMYVVKVDFPEISELRAVYFFAYMFQDPYALLKITDSFLLYEERAKRNVGKLSTSNANLLNKFEGHYQDTLVNTSEAVFRKLYSDYISTAQMKRLLAIHLNNHADYKNNHIVKMLLRLVLGTGRESTAYSMSQADFMFRALFFFCESPEIYLSPGEICGVLKWFNTNNEHFTPEEHTKAEYLVKWMLEIPIPPKAIELFMDTLINNYSPYLGMTYAEHLPRDILLAMSDGNIRQEFMDQESADDFENFVLLYKKFTLKH